jgi:hypothetical protein
MNALAFRRQPKNEIDGDETAADFAAAEGTTEGLGVRDHRGIGMRITRAPWSFSSAKDVRSV